jgi:DNA polymerase III delta prime subunit
LTATPSVVASSVAPTAKVPWTEKYRPATVNDVGGHREHDAFKRTMLRGMLDGDVPHLLLYGPPGTGKTSLMLALAREVYGAQHIKHMLMEVNASDDNSLESLQVRTYVCVYVGTATHNVRVAPPQSQWQPFAEAPNIHTQFAFKWIVLDEADALPADVQKVLRRLMERTMDRTRFCLICNHVERISMPLQVRPCRSYYRHSHTVRCQSRCTMVAFRPLPTEFMLARLQHIVDAEQLRCDDASTTLPLLVELCKGDMRRAINLLQVRWSSICHCNNVQT